MRDRLRSRCIRHGVAIFVLIAPVLAAQSTPLWAGEAARGNSSSAADKRPAAKPVFEACALYAPGHFGNSYEVMGDREMQSLLAEAVFWGFNRYADWFDMDDCSDPFAHPDHNKLGDVMWHRKKSNFRSAQAAGLPCDLVITPNHVYIDQCTPELAAHKNPRIFGQLVCPSKPQARAIILKNYEILFADLAGAGVRLSALVSCPYDFGGCACDACKPWILTYARLMREIHERTKKHHPGVVMHMVGWWWSGEEHRQFADWVDGQSPGWVQRMYLHIPYNAIDVAEVRLPKGCRRSAFVHIGYADQDQPRDTYGHFGPVIAASRLDRTVNALRAHACTGVMAYSEGVFDDVNKAILAGLSSGRFATADDVLRAYATRYFGATPKQAAAWARWLAAWGKPFDVDTRQSARDLAELLDVEHVSNVPGPMKSGSPKDHWRRSQWELKLELFRLHATIQQGRQWTPQRLAAVEEFWTIQEQIHRGLWGLAPLRHIFDRRYTPMPWYADWAKRAARGATTMGQEQ